MDVADLQVIGRTSSVEISGASQADIVSSDLRSDVLTTQLNLDQAFDFDNESLFDVFLSQPDQPSRGQDMADLDGHQRYPVSAMNQTPDTFSVEDAQETAKICPGIPASSPDCAISTDLFSPGQLVLGFELDTLLFGVGNTDVGAGLPFGSHVDGNHYHCPVNSLFDSKVANITTSPPGDAYSQLGLEMPWETDDMTPSSEEVQRYWKGYLASFHQVGQES